MIQCNFEIENNLIIITCLLYTDKHNINVFKPVRFLVDTGAIVSILRREDLPESVLEIPTDKYVTTPIYSVCNEQTRLSYITLPYLGIGKQKLCDLNIGVCNMPYKKYSILGMDILEHFNMHISFRDKMLVMLPRKDKYDIQTLQDKNSKHISIFNTELTVEQQYIKSLMTKSQLKEYGDSPEGIRAFISKRLHI